MSTSIARYLQGLSGNPLDEAGNPLLEPLPPGKKAAPPPHPDPLEHLVRVARDAVAAKPTRPAQSAEQDPTLVDQAGAALSALGHNTVVPTQEDLNAYGGFLPSAVVAGPMYRGYRGITDPFFHLTKKVEQAVRTKTMPDFGTTFAGNDGMGAPVRLGVGDQPMESTTYGGDLLGAGLALAPGLGEAGDAVRLASGLPAVPRAAAAVARAARAAAPLEGDVARALAKARQQGLVADVELEGKEALEHSNGATDHVVTESQFLKDMKGKYDQRFGYVGEPKTHIPGELGHSSRWGTLTWENPGGVPATAEENAAHMTRLRAELKKRNISYTPSEGMYTDPTTGEQLLEKGVHLQDVSPETVHELAKLGDQNGAISHLGYHDVKGGTVAPLKGVSEVGADAPIRTTIGDRSFLGDFDWENPRPWVDEKVNDPNRYAGEPVWPQGWWDAVNHGPAARTTREGLALPPGEPERIAKAAIRLDEGEGAGRHFVGKTHGEARAARSAAGFDHRVDFTDGFETSTGRFVERGEAGDLARAAGQTKLPGEIIAQGITDKAPLPADVMSQPDLHPPEWKSNRTGAVDLSGSGKIPAKKGVTGGNRKSGLLSIGGIQPATAAETDVFGGGLGIGDSRIPKKLSGKGVKKGLLDARYQHAQDFLASHGQIQPNPMELQLLDQNFIKPDAGATAGDTPARAAITSRMRVGHLVDVDTPENAALSKAMAERGRLIGETWYPSYGAVSDFMDRMGGDSKLFQQATSAGSVRNTVPGELHVGSAMYGALKSGVISADELAAARALGGAKTKAAFKAIGARVRAWARSVTPGGAAPSLMSGHVDQFERFVNGTPFDAYKVPMFEAHKGGDVPGFVIDSHAMRQHTFGSRFGPLWEDTPKSHEYGFMEGIMRRNARDLGMSDRAYQASTWTGGGLLSGLLTDPSMNFAQLFESGLLKDAAGRGVDPRQLAEDLASGRTTLRDLSRAGAKKVKRVR